ncbi:MAG TPA: ribosome biogenesis GTP-binding protein YihA/YsxC [Clostridia bacterium]|nr:ribosome biogenesis GTP-binding protein YihA/YsxC [Clostridia bacterium]
MKIIDTKFVCGATGHRSYPEESYPEIALAGRSNVGKSSLLNKLVNRRGLARVSKTPGRTQTINFFLVNNEFYLVDLPGYGYAKVPEKVKAAWGPMIEGYLRDRKNLRGVLQLFDIRHPPTAQDLQLLEWFLHFNIPVIAVATRADKVGSSKRSKAVSDLTRKLGIRTIIPFSSRTGEGRTDVLRAIKSLLF